MFRIPTSRVHFNPITHRGSNKFKYSQRNQLAWCSNNLEPQVNKVFNKQISKALTPINQSKPNRQTARSIRSNWTWILKWILINSQALNLSRASSKPILKRITQAWSSMYCLHPIQKPSSNNKIKTPYRILSSPTWSQFWVISIIHLCQISQIQMKNWNRHQINHTRWMWIRCKHRLPKEAKESPVPPEMVLNCRVSCEKIRLQTPKWPAKTKRPMVLK